ncbi:hypothetical protein CsSME_00004997 [Camellia sinensis var. sinensis]
MQQLKKHQMKKYVKILRKSLNLLLKAQLTEPLKHMKRTKKLLVLTPIIQRISWTMTSWRADFFNQHVKKVVLEKTRI